MSQKGKRTSFGRAPTQQEREELRAGKELFNRIHGGSEGNVTTFDELMGKTEWLMTQGEYEEARDTALEAIEHTEDSYSKANALDMVGQAFLSVSLSFSPSQCLRPLDICLVRAVYY